MEASLPQELVFAVRLLLALAVGALVGWEREHADKPAGLRTLSLVSVGSAVFTILSIYGFGGGDPARVAAQIVTGIGFLGAGTIWRTGGTVSGLTTAASIWACAAAGMAAGAGMYALCVMGTAVLMIVLRLFPRQH